MCLTVFLIEFDALLLATLQSVVACCHGDTYTCTWLLCNIMM